MKIVILWDTAPCSHDPMAHSVYPPALTLVSCWLFCDPEDGGDTFLRNVGSHTDYTALYPRRWQSSR
jgi:hypothetical protein